MPSSGQVIVGGKYDGDRLANVELFPRPSSDTCFIPDLPEPRQDHSLSLLPGGRLVVCGGTGAVSYWKSCISWAAGDTSWTLLYTLRCLYLCPTISFYKYNHSGARYRHTAWVPSSLPNSIVLLGGNWGSSLTAEIVPGREAPIKKFPLKWALTD